MPIAMQKIVPCLWFGTQARKADSVMKAILLMRKLDIAGPQNAAA